MQSVAAEIFVAVLVDLSELVAVDSIAVVVVIVAAAEGEVSLFEIVLFVVEPYEVVVLAAAPIDAPVAAENKL